MTPKQQHLLRTLVTVICGIIVYSQYHYQKNKHELLESIGKRTPIYAETYTSGGVDYAEYYFITDKGQRIEEKEKCGHDFYKYKDAKAIYNPTNPNEYELSFNFYSYSPSWRWIFFYLIYLPMMLFVVFNFIKMGSYIYLKVKK